MWFLLLLVDGSSLEISMKTPNVEIQTKYGVLTVPFKDIKQIDYGLHYKEGQEKELADHMVNLGNTDYKTREAATKALIDAGVYGKVALIAAGELPSLEAKRRQETILNRLKDLVIPPAHDTITTMEMPIQGKIITKHFEVESKILGSMKLELWTLAKATNRISEEIKTTIKVGKEWTQMGHLLRGDKLAIKATGQIDLWPQGPGQYLTTPKGYTTNFMLSGMGSVASGRLVGRIGTHYFNIGEAHTFTVETSGVLELLIVPSPWNNDSEGSYEVFINKWR